MGRIWIYRAGIWSRYPASKASIEGEATIICGGPCGAVAPPMPPHPALAPAKPDARFGFACGGGDASPYNRINKRRKHISFGYTLIELSVVLLILGLILSIFLPRLPGIAGGDLKTTSRKIIGIIQYTYDEAIGRRQVHRLNYDIREGVLWVTILKEDGEFVEADPNLFQKISLPRNVLFKDIKTLHAGTVTEGKTFTQFFPAGRVEKTTLHLVGNKNEETTLVINPLTGRVKVYDGYVDLR